MHENKDVYIYALTNGFEANVGMKSDKQLFVCVNSKPRIIYDVRIL